MPDILKVLQAEHDVLRDLFSQLNATTDRALKKRQALMQEIEANLTPHAKWEEDVFYPAFAERANQQGLKIHAEAVEEHRIVERMVIPDVKSAEFGTPEFAGRAKVFGDLIDHHASEEETELFRQFRQLFSAQERAQLAEEYEEWKHSLMGAARVSGEKVKSTLRAAL